MSPIYDVLGKLFVSLNLVAVALASTSATYLVLPPKMPQIAQSEVSTIESGAQGSNRQISGTNGVIKAPPTNGNAPIRSLIVKYAKMYGVSEYTALTIAEVESGFDPLAQSKTSSAQGVFQFLRGTFRDMGCEGDRLNAEDNIKCAMYVLSNPTSTGGIQHWLADPRTAKLLKQYKAI